MPTIDSTVANRLVKTVEASRLMGANVIISGLSSEIAQTHRHPAWESLQRSVDRLLAGHAKGNADTLALAVRYR